MCRPKRRNGLTVILVIERWPASMIHGLLPNLAAFHCIFYAIFVLFSYLVNKSLSLYQNCMDTRIYDLFLVHSKSLKRL